MKKLNAIIGIVTLLSVSIVTSVTSVEGDRDNDVKANATAVRVQHYEPEDPGAPVGLEGPCSFELGDINQDGAVTLLDCHPFIVLLFNDCEFRCEADINQDGTVDLLDFCEFKYLL